MPTTVASQHGVETTIGSPSARPAQVWDGVRFYAAKPFSLGFISGSARLYTNEEPAPGIRLDDRLFSNEGAMIGSTSLNGTIPADAGWRSSMVATFKIRAYMKKTPRFEVSGQSRPWRGSDQRGHWRSVTEARSGALVDVLIEYRNTGETQQNNVVIKVQLPPTLGSDRTDSTLLASSKTPDGGRTSNGIVTARGINIGSYAATGNAYVRFTVRVAGELSCGSEQQHIIGTASTDNGSKSVSIPIVVFKDC